MEIQIGKNEHFQKGKVNNRNKIKKYTLALKPKQSLYTASIEFSASSLFIHNFESCDANISFFLCVCVRQIVRNSNAVAVATIWAFNLKRLFTADADFIWLPFRLSCHVPRTRSERYCGTANKKIKMKAASLNLTTGFLHKCQRTVQVICLGSFA